LRQATECFWLPWINYMRMLNEKLIYEE